MPIPYPAIAAYALAGVITASVGPVTGQNYPIKPIRISTSAIGASSDFTSRLIAQDITETLGQPVIVENRGTVPAIEYISKAPPDGYSLLIGGSALWITPFLRSDTSWDPIRDFAPVNLVERSPNILVVHPSLPVKSVRDLMALAKSRSGELNYASAPAGGSSHLAGELFKAMAGVNIVRVAYKGAAPGMIGLMGGEVHLTFAGAGSAVPHLKSGKIRALAVTGSRPSALLPGMPTVATSGLPGYEVESIDVVMVPAKTPAAIIKRLHQEIVQVLNKPDVKNKLLLAGVEVVTGTPDEVASMMKSEMAKWGKLIKDVGIRAD